MSCDRNRDMFKGFLSSWLTFTATIAPYTASDIIPKIHRSAIGAARQCLGGRSCGRQWNEDDWDGSATMESDMSALSVFSSSMVAFKDGAQVLTQATGATSRSYSDVDRRNDKIPFTKRPVTARDRLGASFATVLFLAAWFWGLGWVVDGNEQIESSCNRVPCSMV